MTGTTRVYFDNAATTPMDPRVMAEMKPFLSGSFGNPSSLHWEGRGARDAVEQARQRIAALLGANTSEVVFTASGTEADNMALVGVIQTPVTTPVHLVTSAFEHSAILEVCRFLERQGATVTYLRVGSDGIVDPEALRRALQKGAKLVSIMTANNVVGTLQPIAELARIAHEHGALFHTDAVQTVGKLPMDIRRDSIDLLSLSSHKLYGPKGVGALIVRDRVPFQPLIYGGGQEKGRRSGTENVAGIVGLGKAAEIARAEMAEESARLVRLRDQLIEGVQNLVADAYLIGHRYRRLPGNACFGFQGLEGETIKLLLALDKEGVSVSTGSACSTHHAGEPSYVLMAMGMDPFRAQGSIRISLGRFNTETDLEFFLDVLPRVMPDLKPITTRRRETGKGLSQ
jgi:cysteine desulfurase